MYIFALQIWLCATDNEVGGQMVWIVALGAYIVCMFLAFALCRVTSPSTDDAAPIRSSKADYQTADHRVAVDSGTSVFTSPMA